MHEALIKTEETSKLCFLRNEIKIPILLAYADAILIITRQINTMDIFLQHMITNLKNFGMEINPDKSSILIRSPITPSTASTYQIVGLNIKTTKKIKYLHTKKSKTNVLKFVKIKIKGNKI
jgi:hypothetical protein